MVGQQQDIQINTDVGFMRRCIQIAKNALGKTAPNPMVGAVIVLNNKIIGEGFTSAYGGAHAEVNAISGVADKTQLSHATLYVTLEPCSHYGKTPPCADLIVKHKIPRVVIGLKDPHEKVAGKGIKKLQDAGCDVVTGILAKECREHHKRFLCFHEKKRPYIILKWAETLDGFIAPEEQERTKNPEPYWITTPLSRQLVHKWRSEEQAILVGTTTVLADNPKLDTRLWNGNLPIRLVIDKDVKIPPNYHVLDGNQKTIVFTSTSVNTTEKPNVMYIQVNFNDNLAQEICEQLYILNIQSVFIEGGTKTLQTFIDAELWDEARIFKGPVTFKTGITSPQITGRLVKSQTVDKDQLIILQHD
ncbi:bifunctional diaminohydroxyphosphoribosylaminopyrimidine deaminase/5-amino-6-(5-phosphoribosylamino)uracil reductase RibD [Maribacter sp. CXY002]|uniref:bifunctional diaminohydroxyphosphoribosylaminopyrimidine deaminase/5-amino-6-(5-phosphoribosylamino)uracil reductase RibD n=1 Tax=Maribacter luteocoastalis TaxID=3407671 RepID=UPI003B66EE2C